jgi:predicted house-cleaning NTP pyrophosphatase (Maf/HAM1 superfamily)
MQLLEDQFHAFVRASPQPQIILGTQSASRRAVVDKIARQFGFQFSSVSADIDEQAIRRSDPHELVVVLAEAKAQAIVKKLKESGSFLRSGYLVTCDQVQICLLPIACCSAANDKAHSGGAAHQIEV